MLAGGYVGAFVIAAVVAAIELLTRYRDDIGRAIKSVAAGCYVFLNGAIGVAAAWLLVSLAPGSVSIGGDTAKLSPALLAVVAGFGSLAVLRLGIAKVRVGQNEVSVGPGFIIERLLSVIDRAIDRRMGSYRGGVADKLTSTLPFDTHAVALVSECLTRLSNIPAEEGQQMRDLVNALTGRTDINARQKTRALLMALLPTVGETVLTEAVASVTLP